MQIFNTLKARIALAAMLFTASASGIFASDVLDTVNSVVSEVRETVKDSSTTENTEETEATGKSEFPTQPCRQRLKNKIAECDGNKKCEDTAWSEFRTCVHGSLKSQKPENTEDVVAEAEGVFLKAESMNDCFKATEIRQKCGTDSLCRQKIFDGFNNCAKRFMADDDAPIIDLDKAAQGNDQPQRPKKPKIDTDLSRSDLRKIKLQAEIDALEAENEYLETEMDSFKVDIEQAHASFERQKLLKTQQQHKAEGDALQKAHDLQILKEEIKKIGVVTYRQFMDLKKIEDFNKMNIVVDGRLKLIEARTKAKELYQAWLVKHKDKVPEVVARLKNINFRPWGMMKHISELKKRKSQFEKLQRIKQSTVGYVMGVKSAVALSAELGLKRTSFLSDIPSVGKDIGSLVTQEKKAKNKYDKYKKIASKGIKGIDVPKTLPEVEKALSEIAANIQKIKAHHAKLKTQKAAHDKTVADVKSLRNKTKGAADEAVTHKNITSDADVKHVQDAGNKINGFKSEAENKYNAWKSAHNNFVIASVEADIKAIAADYKRTDDHLKRLQIGQALNGKLTDLKKLVESAKAITDYETVIPTIDQISKGLTAMQESLRAWKSANAGVSAPEAEKLIVEAESARKPAVEHMHRLQITKDISNKRNIIRVKADEISKLKEPEDVEPKLKELDTLRDQAKEAYKTWQSSKSLTEPRVDPTLKEIDTIYTTAEDHYENTDLIDDVEELKDRLVKMDAETRKINDYVKVAPRVVESRSLMKQAEDVNNKWKDIHKRDLAPVKKLLDEMRDTLQKTENHYAYWTVSGKVQKLEQDAKSLTDGAMRNNDRNAVVNIKNQVVAKQNEAKKLSDDHVKKYKTGEPGPVRDAYNKFPGHIKRLDDRIKALSIDTARNEAGEKLFKLYQEIQQNQNNSMRTNDLGTVENEFNEAKKKFAEIESLRQEHRKKWHNDDIIRHVHRGHPNSYRYNDARAKRDWIGNRVRQLARNKCQDDYNKNRGSCNKRQRIFWGYHNFTDWGCLNNLNNKRNECNRDVDRKGR